MHLPPFRTAALAVLLLLPGCFTSDTDLIAAVDADYPVADGARFALHRLDDDGNRAGDAPDTVTVTRDGEWYLMTTGADGKPFRGRMDEIAPGLHAVMAREADVAGPGGLYVLLERAGADWKRWSMICPDFVALEEARGVALTEFGVTVANSDCMVTDFASLKKALMFAHAFGKPDAVYVAE